MTPPRPRALRPMKLPQPQNRSTPYHDDRRPLNLRSHSCLLTLLLLITLLTPYLVSAQPIPITSTDDLVLPAGYRAIQSGSTTNAAGANLQIYWKTDASTLSFWLRMTAGKETSKILPLNSTWMGVGFGATMLNAEFLVVHLQRNASTNTIFANYHEHFSAPGGLYAPPERSLPVPEWIMRGQTSSYTGTSFTAEFVRPLLPNDAVHTRIASSSPTDLLWAFHPGQEGREETFIFHGPNTNTFTSHGRLRVVLTNADIPPVFVASPDANARATHGAIMLFLWLVWFPGGVFWARYFRWVPRWITIHIAMQATGIVILFVGAGFALSTVDFSNPKTLINLRHYALGITILCLVVVQFVLGGANQLTLAYMDRTGNVALAMRWGHILLGWTLLIMGYVQMAQGLNALHPCWLPTGCPPGREDGATRWMAYLVLAGAVPVLFVFADIGVGIWGGGGLAAFVNEWRQNRRGQRLGLGKDAGVQDKKPVLELSGLSQTQVLSTTFAVDMALSNVGEKNEKDVLVSKKRQEMLLDKVSDEADQQLQTFTWETLDDAVQNGKVYVVGNGKHVYDATSWIQSHPGGAVILRTVAGTDITLDFFYSTFFDAPEMHLPPSAHTQAVASNHTRANPTPVNPTSSVPPPIEQTSEAIQIDNHDRYPELSPSDWMLLTRARRTHIHSNSAIQRLASFRVGEVHSHYDTSTRPTVSRPGANTPFDPYEYRRYAITAKTVLVLPAAQRTRRQSSSHSLPRLLDKWGGAVVRLRFALIYPNDTRRNEPVHFLPGDVVQIQVRLHKKATARSSQLGIGKPEEYVSRYYTTTSGSPTAFEIVVKVPEQGGLMSAFLASQSLGHKQYKIRGPFGVNPFAVTLGSVPRPLGIVPPPPRELFMISKGSGLTPFLQILQYLLLPEHAQTRALQNYSGTESEDLSVVFGDVVVPRAQTMDGWCMAERHKFVSPVIGYAPESFGFIPLGFLAPRFGIHSQATPYSAETDGEYKLTLVHFTESLETLFGLEELTGAAIAYPARVEYHIVFTNAPADVQLVKTEREARQKGERTNLGCGIHSLSTTKEEKLKHQFLDFAQFYDGQAMGEKVINSVLPRHIESAAPTKPGKLAIVCGPTPFQDSTVDTLHHCGYTAEALCVLAATNETFSEEIKRRAASTAIANFAARSPPQGTRYAPVGGYFALPSNQQLQPSYPPSETVPTYRSAATTNIEMEPLMGSAGLTPAAPGAYGGSSEQPYYASLSEDYYSSGPQYAFGSPRYGAGAAGGGGGSPSLYGSAPLYSSTPLYGGSPNMNAAPPPTYGGGNPTAMSVMYGVIPTIVSTPPQEGSPLMSQRDDGANVGPTDPGLQGSEQQEER